AQAVGRRRVHDRARQPAWAARLRVHRRRLPRRRPPAHAGGALLMRVRSALAVAVLLALVALPSGCGGKFDLPTEHPNRIVPTDQSYGMLATWKGMDGVQDLLLTQGQGNQLFALFNHGGSAGPSIPRGEVKLYPLTHPDPIGDPFF